jgi:hypothetical protein
MSNTYTISCTIGTTDPAAKLGLEVWLDDQVFFSTTHVTHPGSPMSWDINEDESEHELHFVLTGKESIHTKIDEDGNIIADARLCITDIKFDDILLDQIFINQAVYTHDFNGTGVETKEKFYGEMGCNGTVSLKFSTPVYLWLLEHL